MPPVEIHYHDNDVAFMFPYGNTKYFLTVEKNKLKVNAITQYIHIDMFSKADDFFFPSMLFILCFVLGNIHRFFVFCFQLTVDLKGI